MIDIISSGLFSRKKNTTYNEQNNSDYEKQSTVQWRSLEGDYKYIKEILKTISCCSAENVKRTTFTIIFSQNLRTL